MTNTKVSAKQQFELDMAKLKLSFSQRDTDKKYKIAQAEIARLSTELDTAVLFKDSVYTYEIKKKKSSGGEATAFAIASDWHVAERVKKASVDGSNEYNMRIAKARAETFFLHILSLIEKERNAINIKTLVLALIGDMISGNIHDELLASCEVPPIEEAMFAQNLLASGIDFLLANSNLDLVIPCCVGNHARITHKVHVSAEQGNSLEWMIYNNLAKYFENEKRVKFILSKSYFTYVVVYGRVIRFSHGHAVKYGGGIGGLTVPLLKAIARYDLSRPAYLDVIGHFHQRMHHQKFVVNGSLIGDSPYGKRLGFTGRPEQAFFLIDAKRGATVSCPILVE